MKFYPGCRRFPNEFFGIGGSEWRVTTKKDICDDTAEELAPSQTLQKMGNAPCRPDIDWLPVAIVVENLCMNMSRGFEHIV